MKRGIIIAATVLMPSIKAISQSAERSIHREQSETYSNFHFSTESQWDSLRFSENGHHVALKNSSTLACNLNKRVYGWNPYWSGSAYQNYDWDLLSDLCHFSYEVISTSGQATSTHNWLTDAAVTAAKNNGVKISLCATLFSDHATFLTNATSKQTFITNMISLIQQRAANGCNIDFEGVPAAQSANFTAFMIDLCNQMHTAIPGSEISIALPAVDWSAVYDVNAMKNYVDLFIIMGYDYYWSGSSIAGPTDPLYNFDPGYKYTLTKSITYYLNKNVPNSKLLLGLPYYGREWPTSLSTIPSATTANGTPRVYNYIRNNASGNYSTPLWDPNSYTAYYSFNNGGQQQCFSNNTYGMRKRFDAVNQFGIGGIGIWALSYDDGYTDYWDAIRDKFSDCGSVPCTDTIYDLGGPNRDYFDNEKFTYTIAPAGAGSLSLAFSSFDTELDWDTLIIYNGPTSTSPVIGKYTGTNSPGTVFSSGPALTIRWTADPNTVKPGWKAIWTCTPATGINELQVDGIVAFPNPTQGLINLKTSELGKLKIEIFNVYGESVHSQIDLSSNSQIDLSNQPAGVYFLRITSPQGIRSTKIVKE